jgi:uncharacterized membrane protein YkvA (DUF1232 family)
MKTNSISAIQTAKYATEYSDSKFWIKVKAMVKEAGYQAVYKALLLYYVLKSPDVPYQQKLIILGALGYLICPLDLIPDWIPVAGYTDDLAALAAVIKVVKDNITPAIEMQAQNKVNELFDK